MRGGLNTCPFLLRRYDMVTIDVSTKKYYDLIIDGKITFTYTTAQIGANRVCRGTEVRCHSTATQSSMPYLNCIITDLKRTDELEQVELTIAFMEYGEEKV